MLCYCADNIAHHIARYCFISIRREFILNLHKAWRKKNEKFCLR